MSDTMIPRENLLPFDNEDLFDRGGCLTAAGLQGLQDGRQAVAQFVGLQHGDLPL